MTITSIIHSLPLDDDNAMDLNVLKDTIETLEAGVIRKAIVLNLEINKVDKKVLFQKHDDVLSLAVVYIL